MASHLKVALLTTVTMLAFAGNSLLCRAALAGTGIDAASFTAIRLASGALCLAALAHLLRPSARGGGSWPSALALFSYAAFFSFAYLSLTAATGALLLFGAVQATMIAYGLWNGERFMPLQLTGLALAVGGLVFLLLPGLAAPPLLGALLMLAAGVAWGCYSLRGHRGGDPIRVTAGNFLLSVPLAVVLLLLMREELSVDAAGVAYAIASGAIASGVGYAIWYTVLPSLRSTTAATVQLSVPAIAAAGGALLLGEPITLRLLFASAAILGGIWMVIRIGKAGHAK
jgi:drug/metabolite transporter (DMT)-like permease